MNALNIAHYGFVHHFKWLYSTLDKGIEGDFGFWAQPLSLPLWV